RDTFQWCSEQGCAGPPQAIEDAGLLVVGEVQVAVLRRLGQVPDHDLDGVGRNQTQRCLIEVDGTGKSRVLAAGNKWIQVVLRCARPSSYHTGRRTDATTARSSGEAWPITRCRPIPRCSMWRSWTRWSRTCGQAPPGPGHGQRLSRPTSRPLAAPTLSPWA